MNLVILVGIVITLLTGIPVLIQLTRHHPRGLIILFFAEMWERFSYYGMRSILVFYLTQHLLFDDKTASNQYGSYTSLVYLLPLMGGLLADRWLGTRKAVAFGALLLVAGHLTMAIEGGGAHQTLTYAGQSYDIVAEGRMETRQVHVIVGGQPHSYTAASDGGLAIEGLQPGAPLPSVLPKGSYELTSVTDPVAKNAFYLAVSLIIMGVGFLKPNISTIVGQLYPQGDPRRDAGFTLYYYGINLGAFWSSALCGLLGVQFGWWAGFGLAGVGMLAGFVVFVLGKKHLMGKGEPPNPEELKKPLVGPISREWLIYAGGLLGVIPVFILVQSNQLVGQALTASFFLSLAFIVWFLVAKCNKVERERMLLALFLIFGSLVFFTLFEQAGTSLSLFADRNVALVGVNAAQTQTFNAGFILIFAPIFAALWAWLGAKGKDPDPTMKFGLGLLQVGLGFLVVVWAQGLADASFRLPMIMLMLLYMLHTTGELFLSPVGLSEITKLSVASVGSFMMAVWFLASSAAQLIGGRIAGLMGTETVGGQVLDPAAALATSMDGFNKLGWGGVACGVLFMIASFFIKGWAHGANTAAGHAQPEPLAPTLDGERQAVSPAAVRRDREE